MTTTATGVDAGLSMSKDIRKYFDGAEVTNQHLSRAERLYELARFPNDHFQVLPVLLTDDDRSIGMLVSPRDIE